MSKKSSVAGKPGLSPVMPKVPLELHGNTYFLVFSFNALAKAEALTGLNMFSSFDFANISVTTLRAMLWATISTDRPDLTIDDVGSMIDMSNLASIYVALQQAWVGSLPEPKEEDKKNPNPDEA